MKLPKFMQKKPSVRVCEHGVYISEVCRECTADFVRNFQLKEFIPEDDALSRQEGGDHYKDFAIQPVEFIEKNQIGFLEGNVIKYVVRWRKKNGLEDLRKARHYIDLLIQQNS